MSDPAVSTRASSELDGVVLRAMRPLSILAVAAVIVGRGLSPALRGSGMLTSAGVTLATRAGEVLSQGFALAAMMLAILSVVAAARSRLPAVVRIAALTLGGFAILPTGWALHQSVPDFSAAMVGASAALLALMVVPTALRAPFARGPSMILALVAAGGLSRLGAVALAYQAATPGWSAFAHVARAVATCAFFCDTLAVVVALGWIGSRSKRITTPASVAILAITLIGTRCALAGAADDLHPSSVWLWNAAIQLTSRPQPAVPAAFLIFMAFLTPLVALWALATETSLTLGATVALALCAHGAVEMPPSALMLLVAGLGLALTTHEGRGMWAMMKRP